jgi:hypothetical protein
VSKVVFIFFSVLVFIVFLLTDLRVEVFNERFLVSATVYLLF